MDFEQYLRFASALLFVLVLIMILARLARRTRFGAGVVNPKLRRLAIVESLSLDPRRRVVLLRRDDHELLVLLGPAGDTLLETIPGPKSHADHKTGHFHDMMADTFTGEQPRQTTPGGETA